MEGSGSQHTQRRAVYASTHVGHALASKIYSWVRGRHAMVIVGRTEMLLTAD
jgi:hypothetical protein